MPIASELSATEFEEYRRAARSQSRHAERELVARQQRAWRMAGAASRLLKDRFGATRVVAFGSVARPGCFTRWSDLDLAAWGLGPTDTFRAMSAVAELDRNISVNLVDIGTCRAELRAAIEREGINL